MKIHPTSIIHPKAEIEENVKIGPYTIIGPGVHIGKETVIGSHVVIERDTIIGQRNRIFHHVVIGTEAQHMAYKGEHCWIEIGNDNIIREFVSIHRGTALDNRVTKIGNCCLLMAYVHIAHDCHLEDEIIMANAATLAGHVRVGRGVFFGGHTAVHQFCRIGERAFIGAFSGVDKDVPPYVKVFGLPAGIYDLNLIGLRRAGVKREVIKVLRDLLREYLSSSSSIGEFIEKLHSQYSSFPEVENFLHFLKGPSKQGLMRKRINQREGLE